jgi:eukaryotic-like serine/threonine-protein kinase
MNTLQDQLGRALSDRYRIERELGRGGMASVFLAHDIKHDRPVALKLLHPELAASLGPERFQREIRFAARLQHPHILSVHDSGECESQLWFTMPYVEGESLRERLRRERQLPLNDALRIALDTARALGHAHREGVLHRDIKPENLLLTRDGSTLVADFGIAKALSDSDSALTATGLSVGTPAYMSPEQAAGESNLDARSDLYSLGCVLYEMLAGEPPHMGPSAQIIIAKRMSGAVPLVRRLRPAVPQAVEDAVTRALAPMAADRFATAADFERTLAMSTTVAAPLVQSPAREGRRGWRPALAAGLVLVALAVGAVWYGLHAPGHETALTPLAVLPFENQGSAENEYFADGMTDAVRGKLSALPTLQVTARHSSMAYKASRKTLMQIGRELGVRYLLTGTVRWDRQGGESRVQVSPELVQVSTASTKWQQAFDAAMTDVFVVQGQIAEQVARALDVALGPGEKQRLARPPTVVLAAYDAFLRGEQVTLSMGSNDAITLRRALPLYEAAVTLDSSFAMAWTRLAQTHAELYLYGYPVPAQAAAAERALARAEALAPDAPQTFAARLYYEGYVRLDWTKALAAGTAGLARYPSQADLLLAAGLAERALGRYDGALESFTRAEVLDPQSLAVVRRRAETLLYLRRWVESRQVLERAHRIAPGDLYIVELIAMTYLGAGDLPAAQQLVAEVPVSDRMTLAAMLSMYSDLYWMLDDSTQAAVLQLPVSVFDNYPVAQAMVRMQLHHLRGDSTRARVWADSARRAVLSQLQGVPNDAQLHAFLGLTAAVLGRHAEAIEEGERAVRVLPSSRDGWNGPYLEHLLVRIYIVAGEPDMAIDRLELLLKAPYPISPAWLRIDPSFDPIRSHPRFKRLAGA